MTQPNLPIIRITLLMNLCSTAVHWLTHAAHYLTQGTPPTPPQHTQCIWPQAGGLERGWGVELTCSLALVAPPLSPNPPTQSGLCASHLGSPHCRVCVGGGSISSSCWEGEGTLGRLPCGCVNRVILIMTHIGVNVAFGLMSPSG